jgi:hypothetical protein
MLVFIPEIVNDKPLNLKTLGELVKAPKEGHATQYRYIRDAVMEEYGRQSNVRPHWVLMTKNVIEGSKKKSYAEQQALIANVAKKTKINYEIPHLLGATVCIFMHYVRSGEHLFFAIEDKDLATNTRCQQTSLGCLRIMVGVFNAEGLAVNCGRCSVYDKGDEVNGVAAAMRMYF